MMRDAPNLTLTVAVQVDCSRENMSLAALLDRRFSEGLVAASMAR